MKEQSMSFFEPKISEIIIESRLIVSLIQSVKFFLPLISFQGATYNRFIRLVDSVRIWKLLLLTYY